jgi:hypothetical protein
MSDYDGNDLSVLAVLGVIVAIPLTIITTGYTLSVLWGWFVLRLFPSLPPLSIPLAVGLSMTVRYVTNQSFDCAKDDSKSPVEKLIYAIFTPFATCGFVLLFGWILLKFM